MLIAFYKRLFTFEKICINLSNAYMKFVEFCFVKGVGIIQVVKNVEKKLFFETSEEIKDNPVLFIDYYEKLSNVQDNLPFKFRKRLRALRECMGLTREALEETSYISVQTIKQIELNENRKYSIETIISLCIGMMLPPELSFDLIKSSGFNIETFDSKKNSLYCFILRNLYSSGIDNVNKFLLQCGEKELSGV